jgi:hypothetical protein
MTADIERAQPLEADDPWPWLSQRSLANGGHPIPERTREVATAQIHPQCGSDAFDIVDHIGERVGSERQELRSPRQ